MPEIHPELQQLLDEAAIRRVMVRYARGVDRRDFELAGTCFATDAFASYPGSWEGTGRARIVEFLHIAKQYESTMHFIGNQTVEIQDGRATAETYAIAYHRRAGGASDFTIGVRYIDDFERRNGEWLITRHLPVRDWVREDAVVMPATND